MYAEEQASMEVKSTISKKPKKPAKKEQSSVPSLFTKQQGN
jgi:hypothetical protein